MYNALVGISNSIQHFKEIKKAKQVLFCGYVPNLGHWTSLKWRSVLSLFYILYTGIISAIAFSPTHTGMLATGSYSQTSAIYREDNMELLYVLHGQEGGITHVSKLSSAYT